MTINFKTPDIKELKPRILVLGIGGAGGNAINGMIESGLQGVEFIAVNTDAQDLRVSHAQTKIQMGLNLKPIISHKIPNMEFMDYVFIYLRKQIRQKRKGVRAC